MPAIAGSMGRVVRLVDRLARPQSRGEAGSVKELARSRSPNARMTTPPAAIKSHSTREAQMLSVLPAIRSARFFEKTVSTARTDTVMAVPSDMTSADAAPIRKAPWVTAKSNTRIAPLHGLSPTERIMAAISRIPRAFLSSIGVGM